MTSQNAEAKFRQNALNIINQSTELVSMRLDKTEETVAKLADTVEKQAENIDRLGDRIEALTSATERLERGISAMVEEGKSQRETVNNLIKLCTALVNREAS